MFCTYTLLNSVVCYRLFGNKVFVSFCWPPGVDSPEILLIKRTFLIQKVFICWLPRMIEKRFEKQNSFDRFPGWSVRKCQGNYPNGTPGITWNAYITWRLCTIPSIWWVMETIRMTKSPIKTCCFYNISDILCCISDPKLTHTMFCYHRTLELIQKVLFDSKAFICWWRELIPEKHSWLTVEK